MMLPIVRQSALRRRHVMARFPGNPFAFLLLTLVMLLGLIPAGARGQEATPASTPASRGAKVLRIFDFSYPDSLDPQRDGALTVTGLNYEGLTRIDEHGATVPAAAESWEFSEDGLTLTFRLRDNLTYSDGSPLTAEAFAYAIERDCDPQTGATYTSFIFAIAGCEAWYTSLDAAATPVATPGADAAAGRASLGVAVRDDRTLELRLTEPAPYLPTVASTWLFYPVPRDIVENDRDSWWQDPRNLIGNGPFQIVALDDATPDQRISFAANERYWGGHPKLDGIDYVYFDDVEVALDAYKRGELDIGWAPFPFGNQPEIADDPALSQELLIIPWSTTIHLGVDLTQEPFQDKKVREAFAYGLDREAFCRDVWSGACDPAFSWIPPGIAGHLETDQYAYDPEAARQALADSTYGGPDGLPEVTWRYYVGEGDTGSKEFADWLAQNYRESLGIDITLVPTTGEEFDALYAEDDAIIQLDWWQWTEDYPDPQDWLSTYWTCDSPYFAKRAGYCNPAFDALVAQADRELDPDKRIALYEEAGQMLVDDVPTIFAFYDTNPRLVKPYVTGYVVRPHDFWPGWSTPLTVDLAAPSAAGTPVP
jgi:oligopeptide transport system substrate-binding protein